MSKQTVAQALRLGKNKRAELVALLLAGMTQVYGARIRLHLVAFNRLDREVYPSDKRRLRALAKEAAVIAASILATYNAMLAAELAKLADDLSDEELLAALQPFLDSVNGYNDTVLSEYASRFAEARASEDFYQENGLAPQVMWQIDPPVTDQTDVCLDAIEAGVMSYEDALPYFGVFPAHRNCPHELVPLVTGMLVLPPKPWTGETSEEEAA